MDPGTNISELQPHRLKMADPMTAEEAWLQEVETMTPQPQARFPSNLPPPTPESEPVLETLIKVCSTGTLLELQDVLQSSHATEVLLSIHMRPLGMVLRSIHNLRLILEATCKAGNTPIVSFLLNFATDHNIPLHKLIWRQVVYDAIESNDLATFQALAAEMPQVITFDLGHCGTPLSRAVGPLNRNFHGYSDLRTPLVAFLLQHGADPNGSPYHRPLKIALTCGSINIVNLLLAHGARIAGAGSIYSAAKAGRIDVLESLCRVGADLNERVGELTASECYGDRLLRLQVASETAMHAAVRKLRYETVRWLKEHGASLDLEDAKGVTPRKIAVDAGDERMLGIVQGL